MRTEQLIEALAKDIQPVSRHAVGRRLLAGIAGGCVITLVLVAALLGFRGDLGQAMHGFAFWMKWSYTVSLGIGAFIVVVRLAKPQPVKLSVFWPILIPFFLLAAVSLEEMSQVRPAEWLAMWLGHSWTKCPELVVMLAAPIFIGLLWSFRRLAPTRLRAAGAAAGFASGAWAATLYCLHCPEVSALFVLTWYSLGIALAAGFGALIGPRGLRW
jgi:hypothetical protein